MSSPAAMAPIDPSEISGNPYYPPPPTGELNGGLPMNLDALRDGPPGSKPFYPYSTLIRYAIKGSPNQKLLLEDIYYAIESRFPYFRTAPSGWKNSVRHNLSLNPCFVKVPRPLTDRGKGSYWTVDDNVDPRTGVHRVRKRRGGKNAANSGDGDAAYEPPGGAAGEEGFNAERYGAAVGLNPDEAGSSRGPFPYPGYEAGQYPIMPPGSGLESEEEFAPEIDANGQPHWRNMWVNELRRLRAWTAEQEKAGVDPEWYRIMLTRVRGALQQMIPDPSVALAHGAADVPEHEQV